MFEPRLDRVRVTVEAPQQYDQALHFRVEALLRGGASADAGCLMPRCSKPRNIRYRDRLMPDELLPYYERELAFLRQSGAEFAVQVSENCEPFTAGSG